jgi:Glycosyl hydrolase family 26
MKAKTFRVFSTLAAILTGVIIVLILSFAGDKSRGPLENFFTGAGNAVQKAENTVIIKQRQHKRADDLTWFGPNISDPMKLKKPSSIMLGAYDNQISESFKSVIELEDSLHTRFPLIHIYTAWGTSAEQQFPQQQVDAIVALGSVPVITWEPWLSAFDSEKYPGLRKAEDRDKGGLADIARGLYDSYIKEWATAAKESGTPIFLRVGHEMNDPYRYPWGPQNNSAKDFIAAWRHIHDLFVKAGATNVIWVWSPHPAYGFFDAFYPGSDYVDYVGIGTLNYGTVANWSKWWSFQEIFGNHYKEMTGFKKPIMITEFGCLAVGGSRSKWFSDALASMPHDYPLVKSVMFFHFSEDKTTTQQPINWYIKNDTATTRAIIEQIKQWPDSVRLGPIK